VVREPGPLHEYPSIDNPFGIEVSWLVTVTVGMVGMSLAVVSAVLAWMSWVVRWQRAQGEERQQLKWFAYGFLLIVVSIVYPLLLSPLALAVFLIALGIALLKYHLYATSMSSSTAPSFTVLSPLSLHWCTSGV
jgi:hypothetical protein